MNGALWLFIISIVGMVGLVLANYFYKTRPAFLQKSDAALIRGIEKGRLIIRFINKRTVNIILHYVVEQVEEFFFKVFQRIKGFLKK